ncbi:NAD-dependent succinate-semialdehyde dehydrogenase [Yaniella flava]|uniref:NAD-dependent succinate-semialdehyde dehydrogenase n=1 Tax=Yaniella flava TaxID=287930 RepID=A0ABP5FT27_9MICC
MTTSPVYRGINPATGEINCEQPFIETAQIGAIINASQEAFASWRDLDITARAAKVDRIAQLFEEHVDELAQIMTREMGKPLAEAQEETNFCAEIFRYYATHGPRLAADEQASEDESSFSIIQRRPVGPLLGIMPWNFPYYQVARFAAPNLVLGNTILLKHAESCPETALAIQKIMDQAGIPSGVYQNIFATHEQVSEIIAHPTVQGISLTGSERAGSAIAEQAGRHLKKAVLELGGSDPYVILSTTDITQAVEQALAVRMENTGQACNSNKRMIVMDDIYEDFVAEMVKQVSNLEPGDPSAGDPNTYAPMSSAGAADLIIDQIERAERAGATIHTGGARANRPGYYVQPTVVTGIPQGSDIYYEEFFGPVVSIYKVSSDEHALQLANDTQYGLGSAVFAAEPGRAEKLAENLDAGMVGINRSPEESAEAPFGGVKRSGYGRELGPVGMDEFVNKRLLTKQK